MNETRAYLDTSILIKRYVKEENGEIADTCFHQDHRGEAVICMSEINLVEVAVVFDKYSRKIGIDAKSRLQTMLYELKDLERSSLIEIYPVDCKIVIRAIKIVPEQHVYIIDAIQLATASESHGTIFCTADKELSVTAMKLGMQTVL